jgi:hypothetical protein
VNARRADGEGERRVGGNEEVEATRPREPGERIRERRAVFRLVMAEDNTGPAREPARDRQWVLGALIVCHKKERRQAPRAVRRTSVEALRGAC